MSDTPETDYFENNLGKAAEMSHPALWAFARKLERERGELKKALMLSGKLCHEVHHPKAMQHDYATDCPVEALIQKLLQ